MRGSNKREGRKLSGTEPKEKTKALNPSVKEILERLDRMEKKMETPKELEKTHSHEEEPKTPERTPDNSGSPPVPSGHDAKSIAGLSDSKPDGTLEWIRHLKECPECRKKQLDKALREVYGLEKNWECTDCGEEVFKESPKCPKCGHTSGKPKH